MSVPDKVMKLKDGKILYDDLRNRVNNSAPVIKNTASGAIASFSDGAEGRPIDSLVVNITPVQDLHGRDAPYPPGGGANKWDEEWQAGVFSTSGNWNGSTNSISSTHAIPVNEGDTFYGCIGSDVTLYATYWTADVAPGESHPNEFVERVNIKNRSFTIPSGVSYMHIQAGDGYGTTYLNDIAVNSPATVTTYSPYSNECPIIGWTGANVQAARVNLWNPDKLVNRYINTDGTTVSSSLWGLLEVKNVAPGMKFTLSANASSASYPLQIYAYNSTGAKLANVSKSGTGAISCTITVPNGCAYIYANSLTTFSDIQLEVGSTVSPYSPYQDRTIPVSWETEAGTVWNGDVDIISGRLRALWAEVDLGTLTWTMSGSNQGVFLSTQLSNHALTNGINIMCSSYPAVAANQYGLSTMPDKTVKTNVTYAEYLYIKDIAYSDAASFKSELQASNAQLIYELEEPIVYQLNPHQVATLLGQNNLWSNCGSIESVGYSADTKKYVDNATQDVPVQDVQVAGTSILTDGVANIPVAGSDYGVVKVGGYGLKKQNNYLAIDAASDTFVKTGTNASYPLVPSRQHASAFYGLAKASGDTSQASSSNPVGTYTDSAKSAIHEMLNGSVSVSGTTPTITALPGIRYVCGEVSTLTVNLPASGIVDVVFESGSTATVLTINPPTGQTLKWANGFDPTALDANTTYEINVADGLGVAVGWT